SGTSTTRARKCAEGGAGMSSIAGTKSGLMWAVHISVALLVALWIFPTVGLFVSSFRTADQIAASGWWASLFPQEQNLVLRTADPSKQAQEGDLYVISGNLFADNNEPAAGISAWGVSSRAISDYDPGETAAMGDDGRITIEQNGDYRLENDVAFEGRRGERRSEERRVGEECRATRAPERNTKE